MAKHPTLEELIQPGRLRKYRRDLRLGLESVARSIDVTVEELSRAERGGSPDVAMEAARFYVSISVTTVETDDEWTPESVQPAPGLDSMSRDSRTYYTWLWLRFERDHESRVNLERKFRELKLWGAKHYSDRTPRQMRDEIRDEIEEMLGE